VTSTALTANTKVALVSQLKLVPGMGNALAQAPASLMGLNLPVSLVFEGPANDDYAQLGGGSFVQVSRNWFIRLYVAMAQQGVPGEAQAQVTPWFDTMRAFFYGRPSLGGAEFVQNARITGDRGVLVLPYGGGAEGSLYVGTEFTMSVVGIVPRTFATGE
jgi:hypothetical protein